MLTASFSRTIDNFAGAMNFVIFPLFFFSGALYPAQTLPKLLKHIASANPYTYGVDLVKHAVLQPPHGPDFSITQDVLVLSVFSVAALALASWRFSRESAYEPMIRVLAGKRN
jgi:ABC-2 type transport system permease protein